MYNVQSFAIMALLAILSYLMPSASAQISSAQFSSARISSAQISSSQISSAQVFPITFESTPTLPYSYNPISEATIPPSYEEYSFLYPLTPEWSVIMTSYKDTLNVSWEAFAPYHLPELFITCWLRNSSGPGRSLLDLEESLLNVTSPNTTSTLVSLEPFKPYNPCQLNLEDQQNRTLNGALTGLFNISNTSTETGHVWSLQTPAPIYNGSGNPNTGSQVLGGGGGKSFLLIAMSLVFSWVLWL